MPYTNDISKNGIRFNNAFAVGGGTPESFPTIMCSVPPPSNIQDRPITGLPSITKLLKEAGFSTAGFHSNPFLSSKYGYGEGFDYFYEGDVRGFASSGPLANLKNAANIFFRNKGPITNCEDITSNALNWLKTNPKGPTFIWLHYMDVHFPYLPRAQDFGIAKSIRNRFMWELLMARKVQNKKSNPPPTMSKLVKSSYASCIKSVDKCISIFHKEILKRFDNRLIFVTADHGEEFWERGRFGHSGVSDQILKIPLIMLNDSLGEIHESNQMVSLCDILPTIAGYIGLSKNESYLGADLRSSVKGEIVQDRSFVCSSLDPPSQTRTLGFRSSKFKYVRDESFDGKKLIGETLYDLTTDPGETTNKLNQREEDAKLARDRIRDTYERRDSHAAPFSYEDEAEIMQRLKSLGYA
jgi:arylsulfatase A-like enzyme